MKKLLGGCLIALAFLAAVIGVVPAQEQGSKRLAQEYAAEVRPLVVQYCSACHGPTKPQAGLEVVSRQGREKPEQWKEIWERLRSRQMPPGNAPQPTAAQREKMLRWIENVFSDATLAGQPDPGPLRPRRLTVREYTNTLRDLLVTGGKPSVRKSSFEPGKDGRINLYRLFPPPEHPTRYLVRFLPQDTSDGGFDTLAESLSIPPFFIEKHLRATKVLLDDMFLHNAKLREPQQWHLYQALGKLKTGPFKKGMTQRQAITVFLKDFASQAFRRPVSNEEAERYAQLFDQAQARKEDFDSSIRLPIQAILIAPEFVLLWSGQRAADGPVRPLSDHELAARLAYFLWGTTPDRELWQLADKGQLRDDKVLEGQIRRMLADWRARDGLLFGFLSQWLQLDRLDRAAPDADKYADYFRKNLGELMNQEMLLFADAIMVENRSILEFVAADWSFLCHPLAEHYGVKDFPGKKPSNGEGPWYRIKYPDKRRGGVLTMGKFLVGTSQPTRTSPVHRGKWILETLFGTPPPPPPPDVDNVLKDEPEAKKKLTVPQLLARHRNHPSCVACHQMIDPLGVALENFDPTGKWRDQDQGQPIEARGELMDGARFNGVTELKEILMARKEEFVRSFVEKMLTYALGRRLDYYDVATVQHLVQAVKEDDYRFARVVIEVAKSYPFRHCRTQESKAR